MASSFPIRFAPCVQWRDTTDPAILRAAVRRLKRDVEVAYYFCQDDAASAAHDDLVAAEWRLRRAEARA